MMIKLLQLFCCVVVLVESKNKGMKRYLRNSAQKFDNPRFGHYLTNMDSGKSSLVGSAKKIVYHRQNICLVKPSDLMCYSRNIAPGKKADVLKEFDLVQAIDVNGEDADYTEHEHSRKDDGTQTLKLTKYETEPILGSMGEYAETISNDFFKRRVNFSTTMDKIQSIMDHVESVIEHGNEDGNKQDNEMNDDNEFNDDSEFNDDNEFIDDNEFNDNNETNYENINIYENDINGTKTINVTTGNVTVSPEVAAKIIEALNSIQKVIVKFRHLGDKPSKRQRHNAYKHKKWAYLLN